MIRPFIEWVVRRRLLVVILTIVVSCILLLSLRRLEIIIDTDRILPQDHPYIVASNTVEKVFGSRFTILVGMTVVHGDVLNPPTLAKLQRLTEALAAMPGIIPGNTRSLASRKVKNIAGTAEGLDARPLMGTVPQSNAEIAALASAIENNPVYDGVLISKDRRTAAVVVELRNDSTGFDAAVRRVETTIAPFRDDSVELMVTGQVVYLAALERFSGRMVFLLPLAIVVIGLLHFEAFRTVQGLILPLITALLAVVWGLGLMTLTGLHELDPFSNVAPILIIAVAAGHAVQILKRYYEAYREIELEESDKARANHLAVVDAVTAIGPVMIAAGGIAAASFLSLVVFDIQSIRTFGMFAALGILSALVIELTFIPAVRAMLPPPGERAFTRERTATWWDVGVEAVARLVLGPKRAVAVATACFIAVSMAYAGTFVVNDNSIREFFTEDQPFRIDDAKMNQRLAGTNSLYVLLESDQEDAMTSPEVLKGMAATQKLLAQDSRVGATISLADYVARMNRAMHGDDPEQNLIPDSHDLISQYLLLYSLSGDEGDFSEFVDPAHRKAVIQAFVKTDASSCVADMSKRLLPFVKETFGAGISVNLTGSMTAPAAMNEMLVRGKLKNMLQVAAIVLVAGSLLFRSVLAGCLLLAPLLMVALVNFGFLGITGIPLQVATATVAALAIGVGADYAIYFTYRLRDELRSGLDLASAVERTYATAGKASLYVAAAVGGGYGVLTLSYGFLIHQWMGVMIVLAMLVSAASALILYPALLLILRPRFVFGSDAVSVLAVGWGEIADRGVPEKLANVE